MAVGDHKMAAKTRKRITSAQEPPVFLSYRRDDSIGHVGRIYGELQTRLGSDRVFRDIEAIPLGADFVRSVETTLAECRVVVAVIGRRWLSARRDGARRLDRVDDPVRREIAFALQHNIPVIPVLVEGAAMPQESQLPDELQPLSRANALTLHDDAFDYCLERLVEAIDNLADPSVRARPTAPNATRVSSTKQRNTNNLPLHLTTFVGRVDTLAEIQRRLSHGRLVTITGPGGIGKTRLALEAAERIKETYRGGVWLVELAPVADPTVLPQAVMAAIGVREQSGRDVAVTLFEFLQPRDLLLILDNCEHVVEATARLVTLLLQRCPKLHVLATSREALGIDGENAYRVPSLSIPDSRHLPLAESLTSYEAIELFVDRCETALGEFSINDQNARLIAEVCERLDGIPLAIELAAAKLKVLSLAQVAQRLSDRFRLLTGGSRTAMPRQQTLRAAIDWSNDLLSPAQQVTLRRLSVFVGGVNLEAAEEVCALDTPPSEDLIDSLAGLVDKSMLVVDTTGSEARYKLLETIRQYGGEKLVEANEAEMIRNRHMRWFLAFAERAEPEMRGRNQGIWLDRLQTEHDNLRAALAWALTTGDKDAGLRLAGAMSWLWRLRGLRVEGLTWLERALSETAGSSKPRANALYWTAAFVADLNDYDRATGLAVDSLEMLRDSGDSWGAARAEQLLGSIAARKDQYDLALEFLQKSLIGFQEVGDSWGTGWAYYSIGFVLNARGQYQAARDHFQKAMTLLRTAGDGHRIALTQQMLGIVDLCLGNHEDSLSLIEESITPLRQMGDGENAAWSQLYLGVASRCANDDDRAVSLVNESLAHFRDVNLQQGAGYSLCELGILALRRGDLDRAQSLLEESLEILHAAADMSAIAKVFESLAALAAQRGDLGRSGQLLGVAEALRRTIDAPVEPYELDGYRRLVSTVTTGLGEGGFVKAHADGEAMGLADAVRFAVSSDTAKKHLVTDSDPFATAGGSRLVH